jgi:hypothetical protein
MSQEEDNKKQQLEQERANSRNEKEKPSDQQKKNADSLSNPRPSFKKIAKDVASAISLPSFIEIRDVFFAFAVMMTMLKDILDIGFIGTLLTPLTLIITIAAMLICGSSNFFGKKKAITLITGSIIEFIPILGALPAGTFSDILIYILILKERKDASEEQKEKQAKISSELREEYA